MSGKNTVDWVNRREVDPECSIALQRNQVVTDSLVQSIRHSFTLYGHDGCVNSINWNRSGTMLVSGSDDQNILIWQRSGRILRRLPTIHSNNIFCVLFVPHARDHLVLSAAGDCQILLHEVDAFSNGHQKTAHIQRWECGGRVKKLATCQAEPRLFWSTSEDGILKQFDLRESRHIDFDFSEEYGPLKSLAVNEIRPEMLAVGISNPMVPIYDRRNMKEPTMRLLPAHLTLGGEGRFLATSLAFNQRGDELLVNIGSDNIYIFNVNDLNTSPNILRMLKSFIDEDSHFPIAAKRDHDGIIQGNSQIRTSSNEEAAFSHELYRLIDEKEYSRAIDLCSEMLISSTEKKNLSNNFLSDLLSASEMSNQIRSRLTDHFQLTNQFLTRRGQCLVERSWEGDLVDAIRHFICALRFSPTDQSIHLDLIKTLYKLRQYELARECFVLYRRLHPEDRLAEEIINKIEEGKQNEKSPEWDIKNGQRYRDYMSRFIGHLNINTDIKEASWFGGDDQYILAGSDCGSIFVWERKTQRVVRIFKGDNYTVNCIQPHPTSCLIASSGIDSVIRFWEPSLSALRRNKSSNQTDGIPVPSGDVSTDEETEERDITAGKYDLMKRNRRKHTPELAWEQLLNSVGLGLFRVDSTQNANEVELEQEGDEEEESPHIIRCRQM